MSTVLEQRDVAEGRARWMPWLAVAIGLAALYIPTYYSLATTLWRDEAYAHGPIIVGVFAWLVWRERDAFANPSRGAAIPGTLLLGLGLVLYVVGRALSLPLFEVASHLSVLAGVALVMGGLALLRRFAFPILFLFFLIPLPGFVLDAVTTPLKTVVSMAVASILGVAGYPVERSGVVLDVGDHQMLVADACSGLNSIYSLMALGLLYAWLTPPRNAARTAMLLASVLPIAIVANIVRVLLLVLVTYHWGEETAQGFLHGFAGILVFIVALALLVGVDGLIRKRRQVPRGTDRDVKPLDRPCSRHEGPVPALLLAVAMVGAAVAAPVMQPVPMEANLDLEQVIPARFGDWQLDPQVMPIAPTLDVQAKLDRIYRQVVSRTYVNSAGERIMLTVAHGGDQSDALKAHRQEKCYEAQGFTIAGLEHGTLTAARREIPVTRMVAVRGERVEPVTYWFTMGDRVVLGRGERLRVQVESGLAGRIPDGMLVRVSSISADPGDAFAAQQDFATAIFAHVDPGQSARFIGAARS
jgi:exosortase B